MLYGINVVFPCLFHIVFFQPNDAMDNNDNRTMPSQPAHTSSYDQYVSLLSDSDDSEENVGVQQAIADSIFDHRLWWFSIHNTIMFSSWFPAFLSCHNSVSVKTGY